MKNKTNTGDCNTGSWNTGSWNAGICNTGDWNAGRCNTGNCNTGDCNTGDWNTGSWNSGSWNTGDWNSGNCNAGYCNTITPEDCYIFNKPAKRKDWEVAEKPNWMYAGLTKWVSDVEMSDKEKEAHPSYTTTGGYLKCFSSFQHAFIDAWEKADMEDKKKTFNLPNFDRDVFKEIFGFYPDIEEEKKNHKFE